MRREMMSEDRGWFEGGPRRACESGRALDLAVVSRIRMLGSSYNGHSTDFKVPLVHLESDQSQSAIAVTFQVHACTCYYIQTKSVHSDTPNHCTLFLTGIFSQLMLMLTPPAFLSLYIKNHYRLQLALNYFFALLIFYYGL